MKLRKFVLVVIMLVVQAGAVAGEGALEAPGKWKPAVALRDPQTSEDTAGVIDATAAPATVVSYWGYVSFLPVMIVAFVVHGWLVRPKE
jgi:hypothetical protein